MAAVVIDLISSDPPEALSPFRPSKPSGPSRRKDSFDSLLFSSDDLQNSGLGSQHDVNGAKRRRLTPPRKPLTAITQPGDRRQTSKSAGRFFDDVDAIVFSPPEKPRSRNHVSETISTAREPYDIFDDGFDENTREKPPQLTMAYSSHLTSILARLDQSRTTGYEVPSKKPGKASSKGKATRPPLSSIEDPSSQISTAPAKRRNRLTTPEKELRAQAKAADKETAAARRAAAKAEKQREKQMAADLAEVNKARNDKKISVGEMVLKMPKTFAEKNLGCLTTAVMEQLGVEVQTTTIEAMDNAAREVLSWRRKVRARFDEELGHWVPLGRMELREETTHVLYTIEGSVFVKMVQRDSSPMTDTIADAGIAGTQDLGGPGLGLDAHVKAMKQRWPRSRPIYLIEGLEAYMKRSKNARNRSYQAAVRAQEELQDVTNKPQSKRKRKQKEDVVVDDDEIEDALLRLQVEHNCLVHHTSSAPETAEWIGHFTQHISTIPYKTQQSTAEASFCMDVGQVRTGDDKDDTYVKMLQEIVRVTLPVAYGIATKYPSVLSLVRAMRVNEPAFLEDLQKCSNKDGSFTNARIGPALSKRVYKVFMGLDPNSMDV